jgi:hypothetical protein
MRESRSQEHPNICICAVSDIRYQDLLIKLKIQMITKHKKKKKKKKIKVSIINYNIFYNMCCNLFTTHNKWNTIHKMD